MEEIWKDISNYEGLYQISNLGRIKRILFVNNRVVKKQNKFLKININKNNRCYVDLYKDNKRKHITLHRIVANAFIPNPNNLPQINHIDGNTKNNKVDNLEWCDASYNMKHAYRNGLMKKFEEFNNNRKKEIIRNDGKIYDCAYSVAKDLGISVYSVRDNLKGRTKKCKGYVFKYSNEWGNTNNEN